MQDYRRPPGPQPAGRWERLEWELNNARLGESIGANLAGQLLPCLREAQRICADAEGPPPLRRRLARIRNGLDAAERELRALQREAAHDRSSRCRLSDFQQRMDALTVELMQSLDRLPLAGTPCGALYPLQLLLAHGRRVCALGRAFPCAAGLQRRLPRLTALLGQSQSLTAQALRSQGCR